MPDGYQIKNQNAPHFLTFQVVGWADIFTGKIYRDIVIDSFNYCIQHKGLKLHAYVIMSNHVHCIASTALNLSDIVRDFKKFTSKTILQTLETTTESRKEWLQMIFRYHAKYNKKVNDYQLWTHENHAIELTDNKIMDSKLDYIHQNPVRAGIVENQADYLYSSAGNYQGINRLLPIDAIY